MRRLSRLSRLSRLFSDDHDPRWFRYCYYFDFSNDNDGEDDDNDNGSDDAQAAADDTTDNNASNDDAWSFDDGDSNEGSVGIRVIVLGASSDTDAVSRRLTSNAVVNTTFGCKADAADDDATWEFFSQLGNGCYDMSITECGGGGDDGSASLAFGDLVTWFTNQLEIACGGLPCGLPFCADSGVVYPAPTAVPTPAPTSLPTVAPSPAPTELPTSGVVAAAVWGWWWWYAVVAAALLLLLLLALLIWWCCFGAGAAAAGHEKMFEVVTREVVAGGALARREIRVTGGTTHAPEGDITTDHNPMVLQEGSRTRAPTVSAAVGMDAVGAPNVPTAELGADMAQMNSNDAVPDAGSAAHAPMSQTRQAALV